ncbi:YhgE/Pip family protein [Nonomuraea sp. NPDC050663]|uniref:YhgE/Pip family protein n=1 Tax=Nonomuraea sp. NPDC050663 TaxID=3364370 RepID=UPI003794DC4B
MRELRRFTRSRLTRAALAGVVLLPLLYAGLYLWSFWDPQGNLDKLPVALVVEDTGEYGPELADELRERKVFGWRDVDARQATDGVRDGGFYVALTIPADFSSRLTGTKDPAELGVRVDTGRSYIMGTISDAVFDEVRAAASRTAVQGYFDKVFLSFSDIHDKTTEAAGGAGRLHDGAAEAGKGADRLSQGLGDAEQGTRELTGGLGSAVQGSRKLTVGLNEAGTATAKLSAGAVKLHDGSQQVTTGLTTLQDKLGELQDGVAELRDEGTGPLAEGNRQAYEQVHAQLATVDRLADTYVPLLNEYGPKVAAAAEAVADAADALADGADSGAAERIAAKADQVGQNATSAAEQARSALDALGPDADPRVRELLRGAAHSAERASEQSAALSGQAGELGARPSDLPEKARELARQAREIARIAPQLGPKLDGVRNGFAELDAGLAKLAGGAAAVHEKLGQVGSASGQLEAGAAKLAAGSAKVGDGLTELGAGVGKLGGGIGKLSDGAGQLQSGVGKLHEGAGSLQAGVGKLHDGADGLGQGLDKLADGSGELADGLGKGASQIPDYSDDERASRSEVMSDPVKLATSVENEVPNYGTGFAPFFVPLALWVGAMIAYMVLRPLNPRLLAGTTGALRTALSGWVPAAILGVAQVGILLGALRLLGLEAAHRWGLAGMLLLASAAFLALIQAVNALLGPPGRVVALALLMLQLTSAAGTYPIETSPGFFQTISPWLPMSWLVAALRRLISGGDLTVVWQACGVLSAFLLLGLALTVLAVHRGRTWSMRRLHPELAL